eukprot:3370890-Prymnesium_polylepis.1
MSATYLAAAAVRALDAALCAPPTSTAITAAVAAAVAESADLSLVLFTHLDLVGRLAAAAVCG